MDKAGSLATAQTGQIGFIDGIPVFITAEMPLTMSDGKVNTASGTNDRGHGSLRLSSGLVCRLPSSDCCQCGLHPLLR